MNKYISKKYLIDNLKGFKEEVLDTEYTRYEEDSEEVGFTDDPSVRRSEIIDNLTTSVSTKPLSAKQGKVLNDRITTLATAEQSGDEVTDIRVGGNGVTYSSAGDAVRGQYAELKGDLTKYNCADLLKQFADYPTRTASGITFTWNAEKTECSVVGTSTATVYDTFYNNTSEIPNELKKGTLHYVHFFTTDNSIALNINFYKNGMSISSNFYYENGDFIIPDECDGIVIRLVIYKGHTINATVSVSIFNTLSNKELEEKINNIQKTLWKGKTWYSFGTSMSDMNMDKTTGNNPATGSYPWVLEVDDLSGMVRTNKAIGSGGIVPSMAHGGNVKANILACPWDVDLVTIECGLNDFVHSDLGVVGDKSDDTFIGNYTQCVEYLVNNTRAKVVGIGMIPTTYEDSTQSVKRSRSYQNNLGVTYRDFIEAMKEVCSIYGVEFIDADAMIPMSWRNKDTVLDHIHMKQKGGIMLGDVIWSKLRYMIPCSVEFAKEV